MRHRAHPATVRYAVPTWGVGELVFVDGRPVAHELPRRRSDDPPTVDAEAALPPPAERLVARVRRYFAGDRESFADVDLEPTIELWGLTPFEAAVTRALQRVPWGTTISYGALAAAAGRPGAARAAGSVCARGTLSLILPYHRVVTSDGRLGGYGSAGATEKRRLLALEGVRCR
jgi:methylated-DNA-[protein]-cysteine S-methyltransferase